MPVQPFGNRLPGALQVFFFHFPYVNEGWIRKEERTFMDRICLCSLLVDLVMKHPKYSRKVLHFVGALGKANDDARWSLYCTFFFLIQKLIQNSIKIHALVVKTFVRHLSEDVLCGLLRNIHHSDDDLSRADLLHHLDVLQEAAKSLRIKPAVCDVSLTQS